MKCSKIQKAALALALAAMGCAHAPARRAPILASHVDLSRFMGDWYVIASIPIWLERASYNGRESYRLDADGRIRTTYTFRKGGFSGPLETLKPIGTVYNRQTNAEWRMQFLWPFKAAYLIHYLDDAYTTTVIGEPNRKYVWIMARTPRLSEERYQALVARVSALGYDPAKLRRVPQKWE